MMVFVKMIHHTILAALASVSLAGLPAKADLLQADHPLFGADSLTVDTTTGLGWLDLSFSVNLSYLQAEAETQPSANFAGFRHATVPEVLSLFNSAGFGEGVFSQSSASFQKVEALISLIGVTDPAGYAIGIAGPSAKVPYITFYESPPTYRVDASSLTYGLDTHYSTVGNWLVLVPEPSTHMLLIAGGVLALLFSRWISRFSDLSNEPESRTIGCTEPRNCVAVECQASLARGRYTGRSAILRVCPEQAVR